MVIAFFIEKLPSHAGDPYFNRDYYFNAMGEIEQCFSCRGSSCGPVGL